MTCPNGGWIGAAIGDYDLSSGNITRYSAKYEVPDQPEDANQTLFVFNGLESVPDTKELPHRPPGILSQFCNGGDRRVGRCVAGTSRRPTSSDFDDMPNLECAVEFEKPCKPAWTTGTPVKPGDTLEGIIEWTGGIRLSVHADREG